jgi:predicted nucleic acid-binding protein
MYLLDANVISELRKPRRSSNVVRWVSSVPAEQLYLSVITIGEIAKGIAKQRRAGATSSIAHAEALQSWLEGLLSNHSGKILAVDVAVATRWGRLCDAHPQFPTDMLIAATALDHGLTVATRNIDHFLPAGVPVVNPFDDPGA